MRWQEAFMPSTAAWVCQAALLLVELLHRSCRRSGLLPVCSMTGKSEWAQQECMGWAWLSGPAKRCDGPAAAAQLRRKQPKQDL